MGGRKSADDSPGGPGARDATAPATAPPLDMRALVILAMAFLSGGALMTLEIVGGRLVAARFGSHVFVWGGVIGIFMGALSLGYYLGGRVADRHPKLLGMGLLTAFAGAGMAVVPFIGGPICGFFAAHLFVSDFQLSSRWNPLFCVTLIFGVPSILLGAITPFTIRLSALDVASIGRSAARIYALNAVGSIAGTILTAFVLMSYFGNAAILLSIGGLMVLMGVFVSVFDRLKLISASRAR